MGPMQAARLAAVTRPLDEDVLLFHRMSGTEELGRPFAYHLSLLSEDPEIAPADVLGQRMTVRLDVRNGGVRHFDGFVTRFAQLSAHGRYTRYQATMSPWLWYLNHTADCRIFQQMTVPEIVMQVFRDYGFSDFEDALTETYEPWEYCVQYRETALNFVTRLMEQEGICYSFRHEDGLHTLVLSDSHSAHEARPEYGVVRYVETTTGGRSADEGLREWTATTQVCPGAYALNDFDFERPRADLRVRAAAREGVSASEYEIYDYPGEFAETGRGEAFVRARLEGIHAAHEVLTGTGNVRGIATGALFELSDHPSDRQNREYLVVATEHQILSDEFESERQAGEAGLFTSCRVRAIDSRVPFRLAPTTVKPLVRGPQTAFVVGKEGEEIYTDSYGRVKVQFHWDRYGAADENSSCWLRVAQVWAGKNWGAIHIPRIGQEVIVEFLEGDPDRPIVTGRVYNYGTMPPYALPDNKTISAIKSNSSKGGEGFNELRFEDKKGEEQVFLHAQQNLDVRVGNDRFETVGRNRHLEVKQDRFEHVENNRNEIVDADHLEEIGGDRNLTVKGKEAIDIGDSRSLSVGGDVHEVFSKNQSTQVTNDLSIQADNICLEAGTNLTLKVGGSHIAIESGGIRIGTTGEIVIEASRDVTVEGKMNTTVKAGIALKAEGLAQAILKGAMVGVSGDAVAEIKGGVVKIN